MPDIKDKGLRVQDNGSSIRSVIRNATSSGLANKSNNSGIVQKNGVSGKGDTIATKEEIVNAKSQPTTPTIKSTPMNVLQAHANNTKETQLKTAKQDNVGGINTNQTHGTSEISQSSQLGPTENINVETPKQTFVPTAHKPTLLKGYDNNLVELKKNRDNRVTKGVMALYADSYNNQGNLTLDQIKNNETYQKQFKGLDDKTIQGLLDDVNALSEIQYDDMNILGLIKAHPELSISGVSESDLPTSLKQALANYHISGDDSSGIGQYANMIVSPINAIGRLSNMVGGPDSGEFAAGMEKFYREDFMGGKHDFLTQEELDETTAKQRANLDKKYSQYFSMGEKFQDEKINAKVKNEYDTWLGSQMVPTPEQREAKKKEITDKYISQQYKRIEGDEKVWTDNKMKMQYEKELNDIYSNAKKAYGDAGLEGAGNWLKNAYANLGEVTAQVIGMASHPVDMLGGLFSMAKGGAHKSIEGYVDLADTIISSAKEGEFTAKHKDLRERMANAKGYKDWNEFMDNLEYVSQTKGDTVSKLSYNILKSFGNDMDVANSLGDYIVERYGSVDAIKQSLLENPAETLSDFKDVMDGFAGLSKKMGLISPAKYEKFTRALSYMDMYELEMQGLGKLQYGWTTDAGRKVGGLMGIEKSILKGGANVLKVPFKGAEAFWNVMANKLSGLTEEERKFIKDNYELVDEYNKGNATSDTLINKIKEAFDGLQETRKRDGEAYEQLKNSGQKITTNGIFEGVNEKLAEKGIYLVNGKLQFPSIGFTDKQQKQIIAAYDMMQKIGKGESLGADVWGVRRMIDSTLDWEGNTKKGLDLEAINLIKSIRGTIDEALKNQVPGFKEADDSYHTVMNDIKELSKDWFNKDGTLKDSAFSRIRTLTNKGTNQPKLERLEKFIPGISKDLKALAVAESMDKAGKAMVGQYANQIWGVGGGIAAITALTTGGLSIGPMVLGLLGMTMATPKNLAKILKFQGSVESAISGIANKIAGGLKLTGSETMQLAKYLSDNTDELRQKVEYLYNKGELTADEYKEAIKTIKDQEAYKAMQKAKLEQGETMLSKEEADRVIKETSKLAENAGFVTKVGEDMSKEGANVRGYTIVKENLIALGKDINNTTAQHELFHGLFSIVDEKTKKYVLDEAKKILKDSGMSEINAEEWLAESFGEYSRRKYVDLGILEGQKTLSGKFKQAIKDLFQKAYEWLQNYNGDRKAINKLFDEMLGGNVKLSDGKGPDLSKLIMGEKESKGLTNKFGMSEKKYQKVDELKDFDSTYFPEIYPDEDKYNPAIALGMLKDFDNWKDYVNKSDLIATVKGVSDSELNKTLDNFSAVGGIEGYTLKDLYDSNKEFIDGLTKKSDDGLKMNKIPYKDDKGNKLSKGQSEYFKNTQVKDKDGNLILVHHGTEATFNEFDERTIGSETNNDGFYGAGFYFTDEKDIAGRYGEKIKTGYLNIEKMFNFDKKLSKSEYEALLKELNVDEDFLPAYKYGDDYYIVNKYDVESGNYVDKTGKMWSGTDLTQVLREAGYDGIYGHNGEYAEYVVFNSNQFKNKDNLNPTLSRDIRKQTVWQGSRSLFDKHSLDYQGSGEGGAMWGFGHYVATDKKTGEHYANVGGKYEYQGAKDEYSFLGRAINSIERDMTDGKTFDEAKKYAINIIKDNMDMAGAKDTLDKVSSFKENDFKSNIEGQRHLYEIDIPDRIKADTPTGSNYLELQEIVPEKARNKIVDEFYKYIENDKELKKKIEDNFSGQRTAIESIRKDEGVGMYIYNQLNVAFGYDKEGARKTSEFLNSLGYEGGHYVGKRDGEAYVIYTDKAMNMKGHKRFQKGLLSKNSKKSGNKYSKGLSKKLDTVATNPITKTGLKGLQRKDKN